MLSNHGAEENSLRVLWTARRSNKSILKKINREYSLEGLMLKLKLQYFGHLMRRAYSLENTLMLGTIEGGRRRDDRGLDGWMASLTQWTWIWASSGRLWRAGKPGVLQSMGLQRVRHNLATEQQQLPRFTFLIPPWLRRRISWYLGIPHPCEAPTQRAAHLPDLLPCSLADSCFVGWIGVLAEGTLGTKVPRTVPPLEVTRRETFP